MVAKKPVFPLGSPPMRAPILTEQLRATPTVRAPAAGNNAPTVQSTLTSMYFTRAAAEPIQIYTGDRAWAIVKLRLQTAGPVAVSTLQSMGSVTSGNNLLLTTNEEEEFVCPFGNSIWVLATAVNRIAMVVQPAPWLEQIFGQQEGALHVGRVLSEQIAAIGNLIQIQTQAIQQALRGGK